jgi:TrmH family RNA methyltransferase
MSLRASAPAGMTKKISSPDNPRFRALLKLQHSSRERRRAGRSLLDGVHLVSAFLQHVGAPQEIVVSESGSREREIASLLTAAQLEPLVLADGLFRELSSVTTPTGIIAVIEAPRPPAVPLDPGPCVILEDLQDPGNLGSILRSTAAAGVQEVYLSNGSVHAWSPRVLRAGMGAHFALRIHEGADLEALVRSYPGTVLAAARDGAVPLYAANLRGRVALLFGNEGAGLSRKLGALAHQCVRIPMPGPVESLNVAAAAAVCLFERVRQEQALVNSE